MKVIWCFIIIIIIYILSSLDTVIECNFTQIDFFLFIKINMV